MTASHARKRLGLVRRRQLREGDRRAPFGSGVGLLEACEQDQADLEVLRSATVDYRASN